MPDRNVILELLITAKDKASVVLGDIKTKLAGLSVAITSAFSIKEAAAFEKALDAIHARADESGPALEALIDRAKEAAQTLGPQFGFSATQAAGGIKELIAAGFSADESIKALKGTLALAAMEEISVAQAATLISDAISQFGLKASDASKVADILAKAAGAVAATAVDMAEALKYTGNEASRSGMSLTQTAATLDVLAKAGQRGSEAGTGLGSVLSMLNNPAHAATQALFDLGATSTKLSDVLDFLQERGINASQTIALFGEQGGRVINTLLAQGGSKAIADFAEKIGVAGKSAEETAKIMQGNFLGALDRFWESLKRVGVELATPRLEPFAKGLDTLTGALNKFASNDRIQAFQKGLADGFTAVYEKARSFTVDIDWDGIKSSIGGAFTAIGQAADKAVDAVGSIYSSLTGTLPGAASIGKQAGEALKAAWDGVGQIADGVANGIKRIADALSGSIVPGSKQANAAIDGVTESVRRQATGFQVLWDALKNNTPEFVTKTWNALTTATGNLLAGINALAQRGSEFIGGFIRSVDLEPVRKTVEAASDAVRRFFQTTADAFPKAQAYGEALGTSLTVVFSTLSTAFSGIAYAALKAVEGVGRASFEVQNALGRLSEGDIQKISSDLDGVAKSADEFKQAAILSFDAATNAGKKLVGVSSDANAQQKTLAQSAKEGAEAQRRLAAETYKQAQQQADAVEKTQGLAEAIQQQQAAVQKLGLADQTAQGAKEAHAAATQKLWAMQGDFIESVKVLNSEQYASAAANDAVKATITTLNANMEEGRATLKRYTPSLAELRQNMEKTHQALAAMEEAQKKGTLAATQDMSVTQQVANAKKEASDALSAYNNALDNQIERAQRSIDAAERQRASNQALTQSGQALLDAELRLADIQGDMQRVAEITAKKKQQEVKDSQKVADSYKTEADSAQKLANTLQEKYEALLVTDPLNKKAIQQAKEAAASAQAEAISKKAAWIESAAYIEEKKKEAELAQTMAGPIGQLTRLYQDQTREHERAADASERYYDTQLKQLDGQIRVAEARGDEAEAARLQGEQQQVLIDQANQIAANRIQEANDSQKAVDAKTLELLADGELSKADKDLLANMQAAADAKKDAAQQSLDYANNLQAEADATNKAAGAIDVFSDSVQRNQQMTERQATATKEATANAQRGGDIISRFYNSAIDSLSSLSDKAVGAFKVMRGETVPTGTELERLRKQVESTDAAVANVPGHAGAFVAFLNKITADANRVKAAFLDQAVAAERLEENLNLAGSRGAGALETLIREAQNSKERFNLLDDARLDNLQNAIDDATRKLEDMQQATDDARQKLAEMNAELLEAKGEDEKAKLLQQQIDYSERLADIQRQMQAAEAAGNKEQLALLQQQKQVLEQINTQKTNNIQAEAEQQRREKAAAASNNTPSVSGGGGGSSAPPAKTYQLNLVGQNGKIIPATTSMDPQTFLDELETAQRRAIY